MANSHIIIVAAGSGSRFGGPLPKQFCDLGGRPVLMHTIEAFRNAIPAGVITLVLSRDGIGTWQHLCRLHNFDSPAIVEGGATRYESVCNAIGTIAPETDFVMVHDGARPLPPRKLLENFAELLAGNYSGAIPTVAVTDSLRKVTPTSNRAVDRTEFRAVQTPQIFRRQDFIDAYRAAARCGNPKLFTDDASVLDAFGAKLLITDGSPRNIKITNPGDLALAEYYLSHPE